MNGLFRNALCFGLALSAFASIAGETNTNSPPNAEEMLRRILERAQVEGRNDREFRRHYAYTRNRVTEYRSSKGELKKRETQRSEHDPKPVAEPASMSVGATNRQSVRQPTESELRQDAGGDVKGRAFERSDFSLTADLLKRFQFAFVGRETLNRRPTLIVDFKPAPGDLPVRGIKDRFVNKAAGRVWIDEADFALAKIDAHLTEPVSVVGGLVGAVHKCNYRCTRERTAEGLWFSTQVNWHLEGRQFLVKKTIDYHETRENVRKVR